LFFILPFTIIYVIYWELFRRTPDEVVRGHVLQVLSDGQERSAYYITAELQKKFSDNVSASQMLNVLNYLEDRMLVTSRIVFDNEMEIEVKKYRSTGRRLRETEIEKRWFWQRLRLGHNPSPLPA